MSIDPIVEEVHRIREKLALRFDFDIDRMVEYARERDLQGDRRVVCRPPRIPFVGLPGESAAGLSSIQQQANSADPE